MRIERVESLDKRKCKVFTDEDFAFLLYNGELEKYGVCEGAVLEERTERELLDLLSRRAHERALNLLKVQDRTEGEMCRRLFQDGYPDSIVQETIGFLQEYHIPACPTLRWGSGHTQRSRPLFLPALGHPWQAGGRDRRSCLAQCLLHSYQPAQLRRSSHDRIRCLL